MAEDLGTWPPEQATVLLEVLQKAGLTPTAKRTREGILVTVPDTENEEAHRVLVANMDTIARAARAPSGQRKGRKRPAGPRGEKTDRGSALTSERMGRMSRPIGLLLIGLLLVVTIGLQQPLIGVIAVGVLVYLIGRRAQQQGDDRDDR